MSLDLRLPPAVAAASGPVLLAVNLPPSPTLLNQALAVAMWGWFAAQAGALAPARGALRDAAALLAALAAVAAGVLWSWGPGFLPAGLAMSALGMLAFAGLLAVCGAAQRRAADAVHVFALFGTGWVVAGLLCTAVAFIQVFVPQWADGEWVALSGLVGRAIGNLRQPNHLSSVLLWAVIATVALMELRRLQHAVGAAVISALVFAVVLTASRTGTVGIALLALWALADRRLTPATRLLLVAAPVVYALAWFGMSAWADASRHTFGGAARMAEGDLSSSRFAIWSNTLDLIQRHPWAGVGFGEFNFAWTLTPFPGRPTALFDHTHNLPLQLLVELGLPLGTLVMGLLLWGLWRACAAAFGRTAGSGRTDESAAQRCAAMMLLLIGLHSLLEYPLWYAYFLLPAAWVWGWALGRPPATPPATPRVSPLLLGGGVAMVLCAVLVVLDYHRVSVIYKATRHAAPLAERIAQGRRSVLFGHHADYAAATTALQGVDRTHAFERPTHHLLDHRLMAAWAGALARAGRLEEARHVSQRLREFRNPASASFFEPCEAPAGGAAAGEPPPFQCVAPSRPLGWRELGGG